MMNKTSSIALMKMLFPRDGWKKQCQDDSSIADSEALATQRKVGASGSHPV
ncbi:MAG: hypothetical protein V7L04_05145 [Nostoc sp.]|uniref:hypothetical protein n=1 Tax=unclassified Nostoc TaxID=2593658 RepID=UPI002614B924|nr:hypothetical protein [Nostoc sp. S13]MDF5734838.1 hypothetical protein [Nostoc sp. S13]